MAWACLCSQMFRSLVPRKVPPALISLTNWALFSPLASTWTEDLGDSQVGTEPELAPSMDDKTCLSDKVPSLTDYLGGLAAMGTLPEGPLSPWLHWPLDPSLQCLEEQERLFQEHQWLPWLGPLTGTVS